MKIVALAPTFFSFIKKHYFTFSLITFSYVIGVLVGIVFGSPYFHSYQPNYRSIQP